MENVSREGVKMYPEVKFMTPNWLYPAHCTPNCWYCPALMIMQRQSVGLITKTWSWCFQSTGTASLCREVRRNTRQADLWLRWMFCCLISNLKIFYFILIDRTIHKNKHLTKTIVTLILVDLSIIVFHPRQQIEWQRNLRSDSKMTVLSL